MFEARRSNFLSVDNWKVVSDVPSIDVVDIDRIPCKLQKESCSLVL